MGTGWLSRARPRSHHMLLAPGPSSAQPVVLERGLFHPGCIFCSVSQAASIVRQCLGALPLLVRPDFSEGEVTSLASGY